MWSSSKGIRFLTLLSVGMFVVVLSHLLLGPAAAVGAVLFTAALTVAFFVLNRTSNPRTIDSENPSPPQSTSVDSQTGDVSTTERRQASPAAPMGGELSKKRILLASRDRNDRHAIKSHLLSWGATLVTASNAVRAFHELIKAAEENRPFHAVIVDQGKLDMNSSQFAVSIRSDPQLQHLSMILVGNARMGQNNSQLKNAGYSILLPTPLDKTLLFNAVHGLSTMPSDSTGVVRLIDRYTSRSRHPPLSILLAETHPGEKRRMRTTLQRMGHQVFLVDDGARVLNALDSHRFDLTITSMKLRQVTGLEVFKLYRFSRVDEPWIPFIMLLDDPSPQDIQACEDAGVDCILTTPLESRDLLEAVNGVVGKGPANKRALGAGTHALSSRRSNVVVIDGITLDSRRLRELENLGQDTEFLPRLIENFRTDSKSLLDQMKQAVAEKDVNRFYNLGHAIKDGAGSLGALDLYQISTRVTHSNTTGFPDDVYKLIDDLDRCCQGSYIALRHFLSGSSSINLQD